MMRRCKNCGMIYRPDGSNSKRCSLCQIRQQTRISNRRKGSKRLNHKGYVLVYLPTHPMASKSGYILLHRLVMSNHLKRILKRNEVVHHIDGDKLNNKVENLELINYHDHNRHHGGDKEGKVK